MPVHLIQRGNNRQVCFGSAEDHAVYAKWLDEYARESRVAVHAWVFMTNHVHLLVTPETSDGVSTMMQALGRRYVRYFNRMYKRSGTLWEGRFKSSVVDAENYLLICQRYIELNPVRAGMVKRPEEYAWSSYRANGLGVKARLWTPHPVYDALGKSTAERTAAYRSLFTAHFDQVTVDQVRRASQTGMALGSDRFKEELEKLSGRRERPLRRGPKVKSQKGDSF
jgi:putative transposase